MRIPDAPRTAAIIRLSAFGDVLHALPTLEALRALWPETRFVWIAETLAAALLRGHPALAGVVEIPRRRWQREARGLRRLPRVLAAIGAKRRELARIRADVVIDLQANLRSGVVALATGSRVRVGFAQADSREGNAWFLNALIPPLGPTRHRPERDLAIPRALGWRGERPAIRLPLRPAHRAWAAQAIAAAGLDGRPLAFLVPGVSAYGRFKAWTPEGYAGLGGALAAELDLQPVLVGGPGDREAIDAVGALWQGPAPDLLSPPGLLELAALLERAALVVGADTGPVHLAAYLDRPVVALFGPKNPQVYGPVGVRSRVVRSAVACSPCTLRDCEYRICMRLIDPPRVLEAARDLLAAPPSTRSDGGAA